MTDGQVLILEALSQSLQAVANSMQEATVLLKGKPTGIAFASCSRDVEQRRQRQQLKAELKTLKRASRDLLMQIERLLPRG